MAIIRQKTSFGPGVYRGHAFSADRLKAFVDGTNAAIAAGVPIPLLKRHAPINASDDDTKQFANEEGSGWVTKVELEPDGSIAFHADAVPEQDAKAIQSGLLKFTSPEFRPHYECEKAGVYSGPVIRHFAFTPTPGNPHQGPIEVIALTEQCIQLSEADYMGPVEPEQFKEAKHHTLLKSYGYFHSKGSKYRNGEHTIDALPSGNYRHTHQGKSTLLTSKAELSRHLSVNHKKIGQYTEEDNTMPTKTEPEQHAELSPAEAPSINSTQDSQYKSEKVKYPKHDDDAEDDEDTGIDDMANGEGKSIDEEEVVAEDEEKKKKGKKNDQDKGEEAEHEQEMDEASNDAANGDTQHSEGNMTSPELMAHGYKFLRSRKGVSVYKNKESGHSLHLADAGHWSHYSGDEGLVKSSKGYKALSDHLTKTHSSQHAEKDSDYKPGDEVHLGFGGKGGTGFRGTITHFEGDHVHIKNKQGKTYKGPKKHLSLDDSQYAEKDSDNFGKPENDEPNAPPTQPPNDPNLEVMENPEAPVENPDMPPKATDKSKLAAIIAGLAQKNVVVPSDWDPCQDGAMDILLGCLNSAIAAENNAEVEASANEGGEAEQPTDAPMPFEELQFSEAELSAMPAKARKVIEAGQAALKAEREARVKAEQEAIAFAEQQKLTKAMAAKGKAITAVQAAVIPPALKRQLIGAYQNVQFTEEQDQAVFTGEQVAKMVAACIPPSLQFLEEQTNEGTKPAVSIMVGKDASGAPIYKQVTDAEQFFETNPSEFVITKERANEIANATVGATMTRHAGTQAFSPTVPMADRVAAENARNPNGVRNGW